MKKVIYLLTRSYRKLIKKLWNFFEGKSYEKLLTCYCLVEILTSRIWKLELFYLLFFLLFLFISLFFFYEEIYGEGLYHILKQKKLSIFENVYLYFLPFKALIKVRTRSFKFKIRLFPIRELKIVLWKWLKIEFLEVTIRWPN